MVRTKIDKNEFENIVQKYINGDSLCKLEREYPTDRRTIKKILQEYGVEIRDHSHKARKYTLNENYFDNINTPNKAYILGLLFADGCNYMNTNSITICLQERDKSILDKINIEIGSNRFLYFRELSLKNSNWQNTYTLTIVNKHMSSRLNELGMIPRKSLKLTFPSYLSEDLIPHFIRGYFDGDGCICWGNSNFVTVASTKEFCETLQKYVSEVLGVKSSILYTQNIESNTRILDICGREKMYKFLHHIYEGAELYIDRKFEQYKTIDSFMKNKSLVV